MKKKTEPLRGPSQRQLRVGELVRHAVAELITRGVIIEAIVQKAIITVPEVRMSPDLKLATVYLALHNMKQEKLIMAAFEKNRKLIRTEIAGRLNLKFAPDVRFRIDESLEAVAKIDALLRRPDVQRDLNAAVRGSLEYAYAHPEASRGYIREHALEMSDEVMQAHIDLYVNPFSLDVGEEGERAVQELHRRAVQVGAAPATTQPLFVPLT